MLIDPPASTSPVTYSAQIAGSAAGSTTYVGQGAAATLGGVRGSTAFSVVDLG
jgi:hypothetical protein